MRSAIVPTLDANIVWFSEVDSTNAAAARLVAAWADDEDDTLHDTVIVAGSQTAGRGRNAHAWVSPAGGVYATWLGWLPPAWLGWLPIAAGVSLAAAVEDAVPERRAGLKWPNDVLVEGKKVGGVLCQARTRGDAAWAAVGLGVNVALTPELTNGGAIAATCLHDLGLALDVEQALWVVIAGFVRRLRPALEEPALLRAAWLERTVHRHGDALRIRSGEEVVIGAYVGMASEGHLELEVNGKRCCFAAGELVGALPVSGG